MNDGQARGIFLVCSFFFFFLSYFTNDYLLIGTTYHPLPPPTTPHERATKQMKMAQTMVYCRLGHRYPFFFLTSYPFTNIIFFSNSTPN